MPNLQQLRDAAKNRELVSPLGIECSYEQAKEVVERDGRTLSMSQYTAIIRKLYGKTRSKKLKEDTVPEPQSPTSIPIPEVQAAVLMKYDRGLDYTRLLPKMTAMARLIGVVEDLGGVEKTRQALAMLEQLEER